MRRHGSAKVVATLGPASSTDPRIAALFAAGVDVFRLNFRHGAQEDHRRNVEIIRKIEKQTGHPIGVLMDLQGPKLRLGTFAAGSISLASGARFRLDLDPTPGDESRASDRDRDRKSTRLNSRHQINSYAAFCLEKKQ